MKIGGELRQINLNQGERKVVPVVGAMASDSTVLERVWEARRRPWQRSGGASIGQEAIQYNQVQYRLSME